MFVWLLHFKGFFLYALLFYIKNVGCGLLFTSVHPNIYYRTCFCCLPIKTAPRQEPGAVFSFFAFPDQGLIRIFQKFYHVVSGGSVDEDVVVLLDAAEGHALFVAGQFL